MYLSIVVNNACWLMNISYLLARQWNTAQKSDLFTGIKWPLLRFIIIKLRSKNIFILLIIPPLNPRQLRPFPLVIPPPFHLFLLQFNFLLVSNLFLLLFFTYNYFLFWDLSASSSSRALFLAYFSSLSSFYSSSWTLMESSYFSSSFSSSFSSAR